MFRVHTGPMVRQIRWLGPENCEAVFAVLDLDHPSPDEELDHTRIRGLGPDGGQEVYHLHLHVIGGPRPWRGQR